MKETRKFQISSNMIYHTIYNQAGSIEKALLECLMNAVDAGATKVEINLNNNGVDYSILDNGKGFQTKKEIENCFEVFGFDHGTKDENYRTYGTFGIGRAQLWAFSSNVWKTNNFELNVDIKNKGLDYDLSQVKSNIKGCHIFGKFYEKLTLSDLQGITTELIKLALYLPIDFYLDGKKVNKIPNECDWTYETDKAYIKLNETGDLKIYNKGVYVTSYPNYRFGKGGTVNTKESLTLNTARNDILLAKCSVWKDIKKYVEEKTVKANLNKEKMTDEQCKNIILKIFSNSLSYNETKTSKIFKDIKGKLVSLERICKYKKVTFANKKGSQIGEDIYNNQIAFVFSPEILDSLDLNEKEFVCYLNKFIPSYYSKIELVSFSELSSVFNKSINLLEKKELSKKEKVIFECIQKLNELAYSTVKYSQSDYVGLKLRKLVMGETKLPIIGWTDGKTFIGLNKDKIKELPDKGYMGFVRIYHILIHEYLHNDNSDVDHVHSQDFFEDFHNIVTNHDILSFNNSIKYLLEKYMKGLKDESLKINSRLESDLSLVS